MTPFAGVGVNVGMEDALELAHAIIACKASWEEVPPFSNVSGLSAAVRQYEENMFPRAEGYARETWMYLDLFFHERGGHAMCEHFARAKEEEKAAAEGTKNGIVVETAITVE